MSLPRLFKTTSIFDANLSQGMSHELSMRVIGVRIPNVGLLLGYAPVGSLVTVTTEHILPPQNVVPPLIKNSSVCAPVVSVRPQISSCSSCCCRMTDSGLLPCLSDNNYTWSAVQHNNNIFLGLAPPCFKTTAILSPRKKDVGKLPKWNCLLLFCMEILPTILKSNSFDLSHAFNDCNNGDKHPW